MPATIRQARQFAITSEQKLLPPVRPATDNRVIPPSPAYGWTNHASAASGCGGHTGMVFFPTGPIGLNNSNDDAAGGDALPVGAPEARRFRR